MKRKQPKDTDLARRTFLKGLGLGAGLLPITELSEAHAAGEDLGARKRVIICVQTNGTLPGDFFPQGGPDLTNVKLPAITSPLEEHKKDLIFLDGVAMANFLDYAASLDPGAGHENYASHLTGTKGVVIQDGGNRFEGSSPTIDQVIAEELSKKVQLPVKSLHLATQVDDKQGRNFFRRAFWRGPRMGVTPEHDPAKAVATLFNGQVGGGNTAALDKLRAERRSMLDFVGRDLESFAKRVGKEDRDRIGGHLAAVREIETQLKNLGNQPAPAPGTCNGPTIPAFDIKQNDKYPDVLDLQMNVITAAFACDLTRVATLQLHDGTGTNLIMSWLGYGPTGDFSSGVGDANSYHSITHAGGAKKVKSDQWFISQFASLIKKLKAVPEGPGKTMFDNTVILWANHMGNGGAHSSDRLPWILAGSCGGYYKTGQVLRPGRVPTNRVLVSLANAAGVPRPFYGEDKYGGELPGLKA